MLSESEVAKIEARAGAATVLPDDTTQRTVYDHGGGRMWVDRNGERELILDSFNQGDTDFYFHTLADVIALCATVKALRAQVYLPKILPDDPVVTYQNDNERLLQEKTAQQTEVRAVLDALGDNCIHVCEEGGPEDIFASLAVSVAKLQSRLSEVERERDELRTVVSMATDEDPGTALSKLHKIQHEALRNGECNALRELQAIKADALNVIVAAERHAIDDFCVRAIELCKVKAAEYEAVYPEAAHALRAVAGKLEQLK